MSLGLDLTLADRGAVEIAAAVRSGARSAVSVTADALALIERYDGLLTSFTLRLAERALESAALIDRTVAAGGDAGPLAGVPFAAKALYDIEGHATTAGSRIDADNAPAAEDAALVQRMSRAGAILLGALNMDEYAYGFSTENLHYGATRNPHDTHRIAGGSSGGSAAAVAAGLIPLSLGSDTNGSVRVPAALCGVFGLKPTFGRLSRRGMRPFVHSLDHAGVFARTVSDLAAIYGAAQGHDPADAASVDRPPSHLALPDAAPAPNLRSAVLQGWFSHGASPQALEAVERVALALGAGRADLPGAHAARAAAYCLTAAEGGELHLDNLRRRYDDFDPNTRDRLIAGALQPAFVAARARRLRRQFLAEALELFERFDLLLAPATPFAAPRIGEPWAELNGVCVSVRASLGLYTQPLSFIGLPVLNAPVIAEGQLPWGVQLIAAPWREDLLFQVAARLEAEGVVAAAKPSRLLASIPV